MSNTFCRFIITPFLDSFLQLSIFTSSSTAEIILEILISSGEISNIYPPFAPLTLFTKLLFLSLINICSK
jgi:hypothetical protein